MLMTKDLLAKMCKDNGGYRQPHLNDQLFLQCKGFCEIAHLDEYVNLKSLWLEQNAIQNIENLDHLQQLASLFLQNNTIRTISGLDSLRNLRTLNLSHNYLGRISGLSGCVLLETIQVSHNRIESLEDLTELWELPHLSSVDVSYNKIDAKPAGADDNYIASFFKNIRQLSVLYFHGQDLPRTTKNYRKNLILGLKALTYLDERPIFPEERRTVEAWGQGGADAEKAEMAKIREEKVAALTSCLQYQDTLRSSANKELRDQREREYQERQALEKERRAAIKLEYTRKFTELDHEEYERRAEVEQSEEDALAVVATEQKGALASAVERVRQRQAAEAAAAERLRIEEEVAAELLLQEQQAQLALQAEKAKRQAKFDEMRFWVKRFAEEDAMSEAQLSQEMEQVLAMLRIGNQHAMPSDGPSATVTDGTDTDDHQHSRSASVSADRSSTSGGHRPSSKKQERWAREAARFERQLAAERKQ